MSVLSGEDALPTPLIPPTHMPQSDACLSAATAKLQELLQAKAVYGR